LRSNWICKKDVRSFKIGKNLKFKRPIYERASKLLRKRNPGTCTIELFTVVIYGFS
jgi:hypothetical protein